jgi:hypothetical protein
MDPYSTHLEALVVAALMNNEDILELGCGHYSTPILSAICKAQNRNLFIAASNEKWLNQFKEYGECELLNNWLNYLFDKKYGMVFLDNEQVTSQRLMLIPKIMNITNVLVIHDADKMVNNPNWKNFTEKYEQIWFKKYIPHTVILIKKDEKIDI